MNNKENRNKKILILDARSSVALAVVQSLGRAGYRVYLAGMDHNSISWCSKYVKEKNIYPDPFLDKGAFKRWIMNFQNKKRFDYIIPVTDRTIYPLREIRKEKSGFSEFVLPTDESFKWVFEKNKTAELARQLNINIPNTFTIRSKKELGNYTNFPYFVKPARSKVWINERGYHLEAKLVKNYNELDVAINKYISFGAVLIQEYVFGQGIGIETLCKNGKIVKLFTHKRIHEYPLTGGGSTYRTSIEPPKDLLNATKKILEEIKWNGVAMVEFKKNGGNYWLMEINGRFWGSLPLAIFAGVDFPKNLIESLSDKEYSISPKDYKLSVFCRKLTPDFAWFKQNLKVDRKNPYILTRGVCRTFFEIFRIFTGRECWDNAHFSDPSPIIHEVRNLARYEFKNIFNKVHIKFVLKTASSRSKNLIRKVKPQKILIICYGNICRSPIVELYLKKLFKNSGINVKSVGFHNIEKRRSPDNIIKIASNYDIDLNNHTSVTIKKGDLDWADVIVIMDRENWQDLLKIDKKVREKVVWLGAFDGKNTVEINDPFAKKRSEVERIVERLIKSSQNFAHYLTDIHQLTPKLPDIS